MTRLGEQIAALREEASRLTGKKVKQEDIGGLVGVDRSQVSRWERAEGGVDDQKLVRLADVFSDLLKRPITTDFLLGREEHPFASPNPVETAPRMYLVGLTQKVPVFASMPLAAEPERVGEEEVAVKELQECSGPVYFLVVNDDSMSGAGVYTGHRVLIDAGAPVNDGDIVLVAVAGEECASLRQIYHEDSKVLIVAGNLNYRPVLTDSQNVRVFGKMLWGKYFPMKGE